MTDVQYLRKTRRVDDVDIRLRAQVAQARVQFSQGHVIA
jgi:hypothetical protein